MFIWNFSRYARASSTALYLISSFWFQALWLFKATTSVAAAAPTWSPAAAHMACLVLFFMPDIHQPWLNSYEPLDEQMWLSSIISLVLMTHHREVFRQAQTGKAEGFWLPGYTSAVSMVVSLTLPHTHTSFLHFILPAQPCLQVFSWVCVHRHLYLFHASLANKYFNGPGTSDMA